MKDKLNKIYNFLSENRKYNKELQEKYYSSWVCSYAKTSDKVTSILYKVANSQSQPKIDLLSDFFEKINDNKESLNSFLSFSNYIGTSTYKEANYFTLFENLKKIEGWGNKTSALFVKNIYHMHNDNYSSKLKFWDDAPRKIEANDSLMLPVDIVITEIFQKIDSKIIWNFTSINNTLKDYYKGDDIAIWDDLWFWGFITQKGSGKDRAFEWNKSKYWMLEESPKDSNTIGIIENKAIEFLKLLY